MLTVGQAKEKGVIFVGGDVLGDGFTITEKQALNINNNAFGDRYDHYQVTSFTDRMYTGDEMPCHGDLDVVVGVTKTHSYSVKASNMNLRTLKQRLRKISLWDKVSSKLSISPSEAYCELYDTWLTNFLEGGVEITDICIYTMSLKNNQGKTATFWVSNYPYSYGNRERVGSLHPHFASKPSWNNIFKLRELQLSKKDELIERFSKERLECD